MNPEVAVRAWKDVGYRRAMSADAMAAVPANPAGETWAELSQEEVLTIVGGSSRSGNATAIEAESGGNFCTITVECPWITEFWCCIPPSA